MWWLIGFGIAIVYLALLLFVWSALILAGRADDMAEQSRSWKP